MELRNFKLEEPAHAIALEGLGLYWDLHAYAVLRDVNYSVDNRTVEIRWVIPDEVTNPWGDETNTAKGCLLRFSNVHLLAILQTNDGAQGQDDCVAAVSEVRSEPQKLSELVEHRIKLDSERAETAGLYFELQSGRTIEIHAATVELIPLGK